MPKNGAHHLCVHKKEVDSRKQPRLEDISWETLKKKGLDSTFVWGFSHVTGEMADILHLWPQSLDLFLQAVGREEPS